MDTTKVSTFLFICKYLFSYLLPCFIIKVKNGAKMHAACHINITFVAVKRNIAFYEQTKIKELWRTLEHLRKRLMQFQKS